MQEPAGRQLLHDCAGRPVLSFVEGTRDGLPWADDVDVLCSGAALAVISQLSGWYVSAGVEFAEALLAGGANPIRHAHRMRRDLRADPPPPEWARPALPAGIRLTGFDRPIEEIVPVVEAAFEPGHADRTHDRRSAPERARGLADTFGGLVLGPMTASSALAVDAADRVVGGIAIFARPTNGAAAPWVGTVFRCPGEHLRGLGDRMVRRALASTAADGGSVIELAVTEGNPARRLYERLGFEVVATSITVQVP